MNQTPRRGADRKSPLWRRAGPRAGAEAEENSGPGRGAVGRPCRNSGINSVCRHGCSRSEQPTILVRSRSERTTWSGRPFPRGEHGIMFGSTRSIQLRCKGRVSMLLQPIVRFVVVPLVAASLVTASFVAMAAAAEQEAKGKPKERSFRIHYGATVTGLPA